MKVNRAISTVSLLLVGLLAVAAFTLSYTALKDLAASNGIPVSLSWIWPLVVDGFLIVATLSVLRNSLLGERSVFQWSLVLLFTGASIAFNVIHANGGWLTMTVGAVPPIALALALELTMGQLKSSVARRNAEQSIDTLLSKVSEQRSVVKGLTEQADSLRRQIAELKAEKVSVETVSLPKLNSLPLANVARSEDAQEAIRKMLTFYADNPNASQSEAAQAADRSRSWVSQTLSELEEEGVIHRNGQGVEVLL